MTLDDIVFIEYLPTLDLHGLDKRSAEVAIIDFINENHKMKNEFVVIVHGIGTGILRKATKDTLQASKKIADCKVWNFNPGCTIAQIKN